MSAQLRCSIWRYYLSYLRQWPWVLGSVLAAVAPFLVLVGLSSTAPPRRHDVCHFQSRTLSMESPLSMMQSFVCSLPNNCHKDGQDDVVDGYPDAAISVLLNSSLWSEKDEVEGMVGLLRSLPTSLDCLSQLATILTNPRLTSLMENGMQVRDIIRSPGDLSQELTTSYDLDPAVVEAILGARLNFSRIMSFVGHRDMKGVVCSPGQLAQFMDIQSTTQINNVSASLCDLPTSHVANITEAFISSLDAGPLFKKVSEVLDAIGGYEAESLLQQVGGLLASLGRLEALAPLASTLNILRSALHPLMKALATLTEAGWNPNSLSKLLNIAERVSLFFTGSTADLGITRSAALLSPRSFIGLASQQAAGDPWKEVLEAAASRMEVLGKEVGMATETLAHHPTAHTLLVAATTLLPTLLGPTLPNATRFGESLDLVTTRMLPEVRSSVLHTLAPIHLAVIMATNITEVTDIVLSWVMMEPQLPVSPSLAVIATFTNTTLIYELLAEDRLIPWTCNRTSWSNMSDADWMTLNAKLCSETGVQDLQRIEALLSTPSDHLLVDQIRSQNSSASASQALQSIVRLLEKIQSSSNLLQLLLLDQLEDSSVETNARRKRSGNELQLLHYNEIIKVEDLSEESFNKSKRSILAAVSDGTEQELLRIKKLQVFTDDIQLKYIIKNIMVIYLNLAKDAVHIGKHLPEEIQNILGTRADPQAVENMAGLVSSLLNTLAHLTTIIQQPGTLSDVILSPQLKNHLLFFLPEAQDVVEIMYNLMEAPQLNMPAPIPQLLGVLNVTYTLLSRAYSEGDMWVWCEGGCPYTAGLIHHVGLLPRIIALPYLWGIHGLTSDMIVLLSNMTVWQEYPCGEATLGHLIPLSTAVEHLPPAWSHLETIKEDIRNMEHYLCKNITYIVKELTSNTQLTESLTALVEDLVPRKVDVGAAFHLIRSFRQLMALIEPQKFFTTPQGKSILLEFHDAFAEPLVNPVLYRSRTLGLMDELLVWMGRDTHKHFISQSIQYAIYHAHVIITALNDILKDSPTWASLLGIQQDYPPLLLLSQGPQGTADFLLQELTFLADLNEQLEWVKWVSRLCNQSMGRSAVVEVLCYFAQHPQVPALQTNLTTAVIKALTDYQNSEIQVPRIKLAELYDECLVLVRHVQEYDFNRPLNISGLEQFWNASLHEAKTFLAKLNDLWKKWPWKKADAAVAESRELQQILKKSYTVLSWLDNILLDTRDNLTEDILPYVIKLHKTMNSSWIDLLDGLHHNILINPLILNMTYSEFCSSTTELEEPPHGSGHFQEAVVKVCSIIRNYSQIDLNTWLHHESLINNMNNDTWQLSSLDFYSLVTSISDKVSIMLQNLTSEEEYYFSVSKLDNFASAASFPHILPSYLIKENWSKLLRRIGERQSESNLTSVVPALEMVLGLMGVEQDAFTSLKKMASLLLSFTKHITASDLQELLQDYPVLWQLTETLMHHMPLAIKDLVSTLSKEPQVVARLLQLLHHGNSFCNLDLQQLGKDFQVLMARLCQVSPSELLQNISLFIGLDLNENSMDIPLEEVINSSLVISTLLPDPVQDSSLLQKFSDPVKYLGLQEWVTLSTLLFNSTTQEMLENSTVMIATLLEPLVELSREPTDSGAVVNAALKNLNKYLRWSRFFLVLYRGGNIWKGIKEVYMDKPVVTRFLDMIENLPEFALEFLKFGNHSLLFKAIFSQDTTCHQYLSLHNEQHNYLGANAANLLNVLEFLCDHQQMSLLGSQILPDSSPVIANVTMEVDTAMLALLIENVVVDAMSLLGGDSFNSSFQVPSWMESLEWEKALPKFKTLFNVTVEEVLVIATSLGIGTAFQGDNYFIPGASLVYHVASRLERSINESTGVFDASVLVEGLGTLEDLLPLVISRLPNLVAIGLWFPESEVYYSLVSGVAPSVIHEQMCCDGVSESLFHPNLLEEDWLDLEKILCSYSLHQLSEDIEPLLNTSEIMSGVTIDLMKVFPSLERLLQKFRVLNLHQFGNPLVENPFMIEFRNSSPVQKYVHGIFNGMGALQQWTFGDDALFSRHSYMLVLLHVIAALAPIAKPGESSLHERLIDPNYFEEVLKDYALIGQEIQREIEELNLQYQMQNGSVVGEVEFEDTVCANQKDMKIISHTHLLSELRTVIINLTDSMMSMNRAPDMAETVVDFLMNISSNLLMNMAGVFHIIKTPTCSFILSREELAVPLQNVATWLLVIQKHLEQWNNYVDLVCDIARTNFTQTLITLLQEFHWEDDMKYIMIGNKGRNTSFSCQFVFNQSAYIIEQVEAIVTYYLKNESAQIHLHTCFVSASNSTTGLQFRGLLNAVGDLLSSSSGKNMTEALSVAVTSLPGASSAFRTLGSRVAVMVPFVQILVKDYEATLNFSTEIITIIKNDLLVDVNRIYGIESHNFASLISSPENMKRWLQIKNKGDKDNIVKRSTQDMPLETLYQAIQTMGEEVFAESILRNVNYTYLLAEIDNMRMQALLSSDWLDPLLMHMNTAVASLSELTSLGAVMDLNKIAMGQVDPVTFLTGSVQLLQMKLWNDVSQSFGGILGEMIPVIAGSELEDDLQKVLDGISGLQAAKNLALVDFTIPMTGLIANWTDMQQYLEDVLMMDLHVIDALKHSKLNLMALLSLEDVTLEEVVCERNQVESVVTLPKDTQVTPANISNSLCNSNYSQGLAATFLQHLDLAPLIVTLTKLGLNSSLSSHGMTLEQVMESMNTLVEASHVLPTLSSTFKTLHDLTDFLREVQVSENLVDNDTQSILRDFSSPVFLERAGQLLCGHPLHILPDSLGILNVNDSTQKLKRQLANRTVCETLHDDIKSLPGGNVLLHYVKPLLTGKIFYTPNNYITQSIIAQANETFEMVETQQEVLRQLQENAAKLVAAPTKNSDLLRLEEALHTSWVQSMIQQLLPSSIESFLAEQINNTSPQLKEASELAKEFSDILEVGVTLISCMELQRFVPVNDEKELLEKAQHAYEEKEFLAGIVFDGVGETGDAEENLPSKLTYSIRVDNEKSPSTFLLGPRFWRPGPYADMALHMKYHQGFLQLQESIDGAILKLQYRKSNPELKASALKDHKQASRLLNDRDSRYRSENWMLKNHRELLLNDRLLQGAVDTWFDSRRTKRAAAGASLTGEEEEMLLNITVYTKQQPYPCYEQDDFMGMLNESPVLSLIFSFMTFTIFIVFLICQLVQEQESRNRQLQEVMGLQLWLDHLVWLCYSLFHVLIILLLVELIVTLGGLQPKVSYGVLFMFLFCYGLSIISFCYLVSCLVPSTVLAVFVGVMSLLVCNVPFLSVSVVQTKTPFSIIILTCLLPPSAFGFGFRILCQYELLHEGANYNNLWISPVRGSDMTLGLAITMLLVDSVIFFFASVIILNLKNDVSLYLSVSRTSDLTTREPAFHEQTSLKHSNEFTFNIFQEDAVHILDVDPGLKQSLKKGLSITGLRKIYKHQGKSKVAVDSFNLELYEGQVLALLGHNGAGKTTIISMLTKELKPTAGNIQVYNHDICSAWDKARKLIGLCPQQAVLFPLLTVQETLLYYAILKESTPDTEQTYINTVLVNMGLFNHQNNLVHQLSEGMRRRLCMAIAFIGNSKLIILDEPTSGVDPAARTAMWEVISRSRPGRTILLTTHHLDEAETLADRVAIIHKGRLLCVGSPLALKSEYGLGYSLTVSQRPQYYEHLICGSDGQPVSNVADEKGSKPLPGDDTFIVANKGAIWELLTKYVPNVRLLETLNNEVTYSLPLYDSQGISNRLSEMFGELEKGIEKLGFTSLEIRPTSLEDVVIALNAINVTDSQSLAKSRVELTPELEKEENMKNAFNFKAQQIRDGIWLRLQRLWALLLKRFKHHGRDWHFYVQMFVLPLLFIILALIGSRCRPNYKDVVPLKLTPSIYSPPTTTFIRILDPALEPLAEEFLQLSIGRKNNTQNWSSCPDVADIIPSLSECNISIMDTSSLCKCSDGQCVVNVSSQPSLNNWLLGTKWQYIENRYGGITFGVEDHQKRSNSSGVMVWYDNSGYHALPTFLNMFNNARLQRLLGKDYTITVVNKPIKFSSYGLGSMSLQTYVADLGVGLLILVSLTVVCSATVGYVVAERVRGERRVLYVAGITRNTYWTANMLWDILVLFVSLLLTVVVLVIFSEQHFLWRNNLAAFIILCLLYSLSILPVFYLLEGWFLTEASAVFTFFSTTIGVGLITIMMFITCEIMPWVQELKYDIGSSLTILQDMGGVIKYLFLVLPPFTFACGIKDLTGGFAKASIMARFDVDVYVSPFSWDTNFEGGLGVHYLSLALWAVMSTLILYCWRECKGSLPQPTVPAKTVAGAEEDKDVAAERIKIQCGGTSLYDTVLRLVGLGRDFGSPPVTAVSNLFLALKRGECFSLLGLNGAGKTTTFRCLTGDLHPTRGQILVNGLILEEALALPHPIMSYCPQNHALDPNLTPREALSIMALIRGFPSKEIPVVLEEAIKQMGLSGEDTTCIRHLSGGSKRKLSTALALIGNPLLVLLDEPTTGMDPASRRLVWHAIQSVTQDGRTVLLTSHSMDEVNQLSHRMAIMVNGYFVCLGSPHYLKHKLGDKYTIRLKTNDIEDMTNVVDFLRSQLSDVLLKEQHHLTLVAEVSRHVPLQLLFDSLSDAKSMGVTEYDVSQTTLNEVFRILTSYQGDGQVPPTPTKNNHEEMDLPMHLAILHPAGIKQKSYDPQHQTSGILFQPSPLTSIEHDRASLYDNVENNHEVYATVVKASSVKQPSPDLYQENEYNNSDSGSADDSPEEEWTHL
ncbi:LOW QUALITY PROTEIN: uncharacterized protein [Panulirus ornatus]|uniref:LOW QUALITY PROTEIN: uncharacterized protein n=1 Tax=Panulirus ornatus TaxID=150431 RepID=UPI003A8B54AE